MSYSGLIGNLVLAISYTNGSSELSPQNFSELYVDKHLTCISSKIAKKYVKHIVLYSNIYKAPLIG